MAPDCAVGLFATVLGWYGRHARWARYGVDAACLDSVYLSDHCPIWAGIAILQKRVGVYQRWSCQYGRIGGHWHGNHLGVFYLFMADPWRWHVKQLITKRACRRTRTRCLF